MYYRFSNIRVLVCLMMVSKIVYAASQSPQDSPRGGSAPSSPHVSPREGAAVQAASHGSPLRSVVLGSPRGRGAAQSSPQNSPREGMGGEITPGSPRKPLKPACPSPKLVLPGEQPEPKPEF